MQYMLLIHVNETNMAALSDAERGTLMKDFRDFSQSIVASGHHRAGSQLGPVAGAKTVREHHGDPVTTDGPFAETREQLGGYYLVDCKDIDEAVGLARRIPSVRGLGSVEVRGLI